MGTVSKPLFAFVLAVAAAVVPLLPLSSNAAAAERKFSVSNGKVNGRPQTICLLEGNWPDGRPLRYQAWDSCAAIKVRMIPHDNRPLSHIAGVTSRESNVPADVDVLEISNRSSRAWIYLDQNGRLQDVMVGD